MEKYIYCIIQDEEEGTVIYVTPKQYWEEKRYLSDEHSDDHISDVLNEICNGIFSEEQESIFATCDCEQIPTEQILKELDSYKNILEYSKELEEFIL